ncbi:MAG TPA: hypothetical protein VIO94_12975 [Phenylobacterium sp.]
MALPAPDWNAVNALAATATAIVATLTLPWVVLQLVLTRRVHVEQLIERSASARIQNHLVLRRLRTHVVRKLPFSFDDLHSLRDAQLRLESQLPAIEAEIRLRGRKASKKTVENYNSDLESLLEVLVYAYECSAERMSKLQADVEQIGEQVLARFNAEPEDANAFRAARASRNTEESHRLLDAIVLKRAAKLGASAEEIAHIQTKKADVTDEEGFKFFEQMGGDIDNERALEAWLSELKVMLESARTLVRALPGLLGGAKLPAKGAASA